MYIHTLNINGVKLKDIVLVPIYLKLDVCCIFKKINSLAIHWHLTTYRLVSCHVTCHSYLTV